MTIRITEDTTRPEIEEALAHLCGKAKRTPAHWVDRYVAVHQAIDELLVQWERSGSGEVQQP